MEQCSLSLESSVVLCLLVSALGRMASGHGLIPRFCTAPIAFAKPLLAGSPRGKMGQEDPSSHFTDVETETQGRPVTWAG